MKPVAVLISFLLVSTLLLIWIYVLRSVWTKPSKFRSVVMKASVSVSTCIYLFLILEILFYSTFTMSDGFGFTLASKRWGEKYWHPINSLGYRDVEHDPVELNDKKVILIVGSSFVAGHGIRKIEDRFSDILQRNLGPQYLVANIARSGWDTGQEYQAIVSYPHKPKRIVFCYGVNDIAGLARKAGQIPTILVEPPQNPALLYIVENSYSLNFAYWRLYRFRNKDIGDKYWRSLKQSYSSEDVWGAHQSQLKQIVEFTRNQGIELTVLVFPNLTAVKDSAPITSKVTAFFQSLNVRVLNLEPLLEGRDPTTLVVNGLDAHPNETLNQEVAELLTRELQTESRVMTLILCRSCPGVNNRFLRLPFITN